MLLDAGYKDVFSIEGGIKAWKGLVAGGPPEAGMAYFSAAGSPGEFIALAWSLEAGSRRFYVEIAASLADDGVARIFQDLAAAEEKHQSSLSELFRQMAAQGTGATTTMESLLPGISPGTIMEGGVRVAEALEWTKGKSIPDVLDLAIALETNAYDLAVKMERVMEDEHARQVFRAIALEEKRHLDRMAALMERSAGPETPSS